MFVLIERKGVPGGNCVPVSVARNTTRRAAASIEVLDGYRVDGALVASGETGGRACMTRAVGMGVYD